MSSSSEILLISHWAIDLSSISLDDLPGPKFPVKKALHRPCRLLNLFVKKPCYDLNLVLKKALCNRLYVIFTPFSRVLVEGTKFSICDTIRSHHDPASTAVTTAVNVFQPNTRTRVQSLNLGGRFFVPYFTHRGARNSD